MANNQRQNETDPFRPANQPPPMAAAPAGPNPKRVPDGELPRPPRHVLRPDSEYVEFEEESVLRIPQSDWPPGFALQWVTESVWGQPMPQNRARHERGGWVSVHQEDFDGRYRGKYMPAKYEGEIVHDGLVLMARSKSWNDKATYNNIRRAQQRVMIKEQQLRMGDLSGVTLDAGHKTAIASNIVERSIDTVALPVPNR